MSIIHYYQKVKDRHKRVIRDYSIVQAILISTILLFLSLILNYFAAQYAFDRATSAVGDIILSNIPVVDVDWIFVFGPILFFFILFIYLLHNPEAIPFTFKSIALFVLIRSFFITLTHIGPFPDHTIIAGNSAILLRAISDNPNFFLFSTGADLFFSGHTGLPFLLGLIFWQNRLMRFFCISVSVFFGIVVLLGHLHYSIDVASAFFITYTIYIIASKIFHKEKNRLIATLD